MPPLDDWIPSFEYFWWGLPGQLLQVRLSCFGTGNIVLH